MGRTLEEKKAVVASLKENLSKAQLAVVIDFKGLSVAEIGDLRNRLRDSGATCKVAKNSLMNLAVEGDENWQPMQSFLKDSSAFLLVPEDFSGAIKAYRDFKKATKKTELRGGVMEGRLLNQAQVDALGDLPTKEELYAQIAGTINALATKIAVGIKEVPSSLARGLQAYADKEDNSESNKAG